MKKNDLSTYNVQGMNKNELIQINGGTPFSDGHEAGETAGQYVGAFLMMCGIYAFYVALV